MQLLDIMLYATDIRGIYEQEGVKFSSPLIIRDDGTLALDLSDKRKLEEVS